MINLLVQSSPSLKLIIYNFHYKVKLSHVYQKLLNKNDTYQFIDRLVENRLQYSDPPSRLIGYLVQVLVNEK